MRVLLLAPHPFFQLRGSPIAEKALLEALSRRGDEFHVLTYAEGEDPGIDGCTLHRIPAPPWTSGIHPGFSMKKLACDTVMLASCVRLVREIRPDVIHATEEAVFMALVARAGGDIPIVYDMDSSLPRQMVQQYRWLRPFERWLRRLEEVAIRRSTAVLAVTGELASRVRSVDPGKLVASIEDMSLLDGPAAADEDEVEDLRRTVEAGGSDPLALYVGNLMEYQGIDLLLRAFAVTLRSVPHARLVIVGGDPAHIREYRLMARRLRIDGAARLVGSRPLSHLGGLLRQADVLVSPRCSGANTPLKIFSYMDSGVPILATRLTTHTQVLDDEIAALAEPKPRPMGESLARLFRDQELRRELATRARAMARERYTRARFDERVIAFYDALEARLRGSPPSLSTALARGPTHGGVPPGASAAGEYRSPPPSRGSAGPSVGEEDTERGPSGVRDPGPGDRKDEPRISTGPGGHRERGET